MIINPNNKTVTVIDGGNMEDGKEGLRSAAEELMHSFKSGDVEGLMQSLHNFFTLCDEMPHEEGEHMYEGGEVESQHWPLGQKDDGYPVTAQEDLAEYMGERYR